MRVTKKSLGIASLSLLALLGYARRSEAQTVFDNGVINNRWVVNVDATGILFNTSGKINVAGQRIPGTLKLANTATMTFDVGYYFFNNFTVDVVGGIPPHSTASGAGEASSLGPAGKVNVAPAVVQILYHFTDLGPFHPFIGGGVNYTIFMNKVGINVSDFHVKDNWGGAVTGGIVYDLSENWGINVTASQIFLSSTAKGSVGPAPVAVKVVANPTAISMGVTYHF